MVTHKCMVKDFDKPDAHAGATPYAVGLALAQLGRGNKTVTRIQREMRILYRKFF